MPSAPSRRRPTPCPRPRRSIPLPASPASAGRPPARAQGVRSRFMPPSPPATRRTVARSEEWVQIRVQGAAKSGQCPSTSPPKARAADEGGPWQATMRPSRSCNSGRAPGAALRRGNPPGGTNPTTVVIGETGSGKAAQISQILHRFRHVDAGGRMGVAITQPRARRGVRRETRRPRDGRQDRNLGRIHRPIRGLLVEGGRIKYMTDGTLPAVPRGPEPVQVRRDRPR